MAEALRQWMIRTPMMAAFSLFICGVAMGALASYAMQDKSAAEQAEPPSGESIRLRKREVFSRPLEVA